MCFPHSSYDITTAQIQLKQVQALNVPTTFQGSPSKLLSYFSLMHRMSFQIPTSIFSQEGGESTTAELCNSSETAGILPSALEAHLSATCQLNEGRALKKNGT